MGACMILWSEGKSLIRGCALIIRENKVTVQSETCDGGVTILLFYPLVLLIRTQ